MLRRWFTSALSATFGKGYNPLNKAVRRIREKMKRFRDSYFILFAIILTISLTYVTNNLSLLWLWLSSGYFYLRWLLLVSAVVIIFLALRQLWREIQKLDENERRQQRKEQEKRDKKLVKAFKQAMLKALAEDREKDVKQ